MRSTQDFRPAFAAAFAALALVSLTAACSKGGSASESGPDSGAQAPWGASPPATADSLASAGGQGQRWSATLDASAFDPANFLEPLPSDSEPIDVTLPGKGYAGGRVLALPASYLSDPMSFAPAPALAFKADRYAIVASDQAAIYADPFGGATPTQDKLAGLKKLAPIPFGTVLAIKGELRDESPEPEYGGFFRFEDNLNHFYRIEFGGRQGIVFGADLEALDKDASEVAKLAYYYNKPAKAPAFLPLDGLRPLDASALAKLGADYLAFAGPPEYSLSVYSPDDLIAVYQDAFRDRAATIFLTTDLFAHALHLLFDRTLQAIEETRFIPILKAVIQGQLDAIEARAASDKGSSPAYTEAVALARDYFTIAKALLAMATLPPPPDEYGREPDEASLEEVDPAAAWAGLPERVRAELELVMEAKGFAASPTFGYNEDYSQFKPRGHYTKNPRLKAYFRAMMFLGRFNMYFDFSTPEAAALSMKLAPVALIASQTHFSDSRLAGLWTSLYEPIAYLIGESDDITFADMEKPLGATRTADLEKLMGSAGFRAELERIGKALRPPRIQGNVTYGNPSAANAAGSGDSFGEPPKGWRFLGQRFVLDSWWTDRLTGDPRTMAEGLDIAAALGSKAAYAYHRKSPLPFKVDLQTLDAIIAENAPRAPAVWEKTFYNHYLALAGSMVGFERGPALYYARSPLWDDRALQSGLAAWAELRHDTILYVKQSYAERSGGGDWEATWRTRPFARPMHLVEPNLPFFYRLARLLEQGLPLLAENRLLPEDWALKFRDFYNVVNRVTAIAETQAADRAIKADDNEWLVTIPDQLARIVLPTGGDWVNDPDLFKMALVADVHTDSDAGAVLEVATGKPWTLYLAANDGSGGKRVAKGFTYSYYEFAQPMSDRLDDDQWKAFIYGAPSKTELEAMRPWWLKGKLP